MQLNRVRELRKKRGLTQRKLAELAGTSQQQIQRIEAGTQNARFDLAVSICGALGATMAEAFPSTEIALKRAGKRQSLSDIYSDKRTVADLKAAGLDMRPEHWTFRYRVRGGGEGDLPISGSDYERLWSLVQRSEDRSFLVFDSGSHRYAIQRRHLTFCQFLYEGLAVPSEEDVADQPYAEFRLAEGGEPLTFFVEPDGVSLDDEDAEEGRDTQLQSLFFSVELGLDPDEWLTFEDGDGESAFVRVGDVAMFSIPLNCVEPGMDDYEDEDGEIGEGAPVTA